MAIALEIDFPNARQEHYDAYYEGTLAAAFERSGMPQPNPPQVFEVYNIER